jgi:hypothetical protein
MPIAKRDSAGAEAAETLAIQALAFLAADTERIARFLAVTGLGPEDIRASASHPDFLGGVLEYLASDERLLIEFTKEIAADPAEIARACATLGRGPHERDGP